MIIRIRNKAGYLERRRDQKAQNLCTPIYDKLHQYCIQERCLRSVYLQFMHVISNCRFVKSIYFIAPNRWSYGIVLYEIFTLG